MLSTFTVMGNRLDALCAAAKHFCLRLPPSGAEPQTGQAIFLGPLFVGVLAALALIFPPQSREVYVAMVSNSFSSSDILGLVGVAWLSVAIYAWNARLMNRHIEVRYRDAPSLVVDLWLKQLRDVKCLIAAVLPLAGLVSGLIAAVPEMHGAQVHVKPVNAALAADIKATAEQLVLAAAIVAVLGGLVILALMRWHSWQLVRRLHWVTVGIAAAVYIVPWRLEAITLVPLAQSMGPLCILALFFTTLIPTLQVLGWVLRTVFFGFFVAVFSFVSRYFPVWFVCVICAAGIGYLLLNGYFTIRQPPSFDPIPEARRQDDEPPRSETVEAKFDRWLEARFERWLIGQGLSKEAVKKAEVEREKAASRGEAVSKVRSFPVFVAAAQGGGIYAAASTMGFLASIQDRCANFQDHTFMIGAVSGGALGASVYRGLAAETARVAPCTRGDGAMSRAVKPIATKDHLSPVLLATPLDWLSKVPALAARFFGGILQWFGERLGLAFLQPDPAYLASLHPGYRQSSDMPIPRQTMLWRVYDWLLDQQTKLRANALTESFAGSYRAQSGTRSDQGLTENIDRYWSPQSPSPALALALTSVETGHRVAFAPFSLTKVGDGTLHAFGDLGRRLNLDKPSQKILTQQRIIDAAVTSARFPGVLPAWSIVHYAGDRESGGPQMLRRLNFVDGGYADSSGATMSVDVVRRLRAHIEARIANGEIELRRVQLNMIILTDNETTRDLSSVNGTNLPDTRAPIDALFNARQLVAGTALTGAVNELNQMSVPVHKIELDHRVFKLPLGWLLSETSNKILQTMLGTPESAETGDGADKCYKKSPPNALDLEGKHGRLTHFQEVVRANSCTQKAIVDLLSR